MVEVITIEEWANRKRYDKVPYLKQVLEDSSCNNENIAFVRNSINMPFEHVLLGIEKYSYNYPKATLYISPNKDKADELMKVKIDQQPKKYHVRFAGVRGYLTVQANRRSEAIREARKLARSIIGRKEYFDTESVEVDDFTS